jgi:hypothetical protein
MILSIYESHFPTVQSMEPGLDSMQLYMEIM